MGVPVWVVDRAVHVRRLNDAASRFSARLAGPGEPVGRPLAAVLDLEAPAAGRVAAAVAAAADATVTGTAAAAVPVILTVSPLRLDAAVAGAVVVAQEIVAEQRLPEHLREQRLAALGQLAAGAAHEIRNPLTAIHGFLQLLQQECREGAATRYLQIVRQEMERIEGITSDLLLLSRSPAQRLRPCALGPLLQGLCELLRERAADRGVRLQLTLEEAAEVAAVPERLRQVFLNLLGNAIEAMPGGGTVHVCVRRSPPWQGEYYEVVVEDEGAGIPASVLPRVFEPFFTTKAGGTGLGLAVSESIVRGFGGHITVESPPGRGAVFTVRLPVGSAGASAEVAAGAAVGDADPAT